ncbi:MAG: PKD domain-containing protein [Candidatus Aminicenantales bacterium]
MKSKKIVFFTVALLILFSLSTFAETKKLTRIGLHPFARVKGKVLTEEGMRTIAEKYAGDIKFGFDMAGAGDLYLDFIEQLSTATFTEKSLPAGEKMKWMLFRVGKKIKVWEDVEWAGKKPLDVFSYMVKKDYTNYEFIIPRSCGNIALYNVTELPPPPPPAVCNIVVTPAKANVNEPITVDMSQSKNAKAVEIEVYSSQGSKIAVHKLTPQDPKWQVKFDQPGEYVFKGNAWNVEDKVSTNPCEAKTYINFPPVCKLWTSCLPCKDYVGKPITFDASGSSDTDGEIVKASFEVADDVGTVIDSFVDTEKPFTWEKIFYSPGNYTIRVVVYDDMGAISPSSDPCTIAFEVTQKKFFFLVEGGGMLARGTYTGYFFARAGLMWNLVPQALDFILAGGGAMPSKGDPWQFVWMFHGLLNIEFGPAYLGTGLGYSTKEQDIVVAGEPFRRSGFDLVANLGVNVFNNYSSAGSIFSEVRIPVITKNRRVGDHYKLLLGFRFIF